MTANRSATLRFPIKSGQCSRRRRYLRLSCGQGCGDWRWCLARDFQRRMGRAEVILVGTHVVVWLAFDQDRLSKKARAAIDDARQNGDGLAISDITLLELAALFRKGRIRLEIGLESFLDEVEARFVVLPISGRACARALGLPAAYPKDPADRMTGATALVEGMSLLTADREIRKAQAVRTIWELLLHRNRL